MLWAYLLGCIACAIWFRSQVNVIKGQVGWFIFMVLIWPLSAALVGYLAWQLNRFLKHYKIR